MKPPPSGSTVDIDETLQICSSPTTFVPSVILPGQSRVCLWYWEGGQSRAFLDNPLNSRWIILDHMRTSENWFCQWLTFDRIMAEVHSILLPLHFWKLLFGSNQGGGGRCWGGVGGRGSWHRICFWHTAKVTHIPDSFIFEATSPITWKHFQQVIIFLFMNESQGGETDLRRPVYCLSEEIRDRWRKWQKIQYSRKYTTSCVPAFSSHNWNWNTNTKQPLVRFLTCYLKILSIKTVIF